MKTYQHRANVRYWSIAFILIALLLTAFSPFAAGWLGASQAVTPPPSPAQISIVVGGDHNYPPYEYLQNGTPTGFDVDLVRAVAETMGMNVTFRLLPWAEARRELNSGEVDMLAGMAYSDQRTQEVDYSASYLTLTFDLFVVRNSKIHNLADLNGKIVAVQKGGVMEEFLRGQNAGAQMFTVSNVPDALRAVSAGKADAALVNKVQGIYFSKEYDLSNLRPVNSDPIQIKYAFAVAKDNEALLARLNDGLRIVQDTGKYREIHDRWFGAYEQLISRETMQWVMILVGGILITLIAALIWIAAMRSQVQARTREVKISEEKYRRVVENAAEGIVVLADRHIKFFNPSAVRLTGRSAEQLQGLDIGEIIHPADWMVLEQRLKNRLAGSPDIQNMPFRILTPGGEVRWLTQNSELMTWENQPALLAMITDVTEQKAAEEALRASEEKFSKAFRTSPDAVAINRLSDGCYLEINQGFTQLVGYSEAEILGRTSLELGIWPIPAQREELVRRLLQQGEVRGMEINVRRKDGITRIGLMSAHLMEINGEKCIMSISHDISERKEIEEQIQRQVRHLRTLHALDQAIAGTRDLAPVLDILLQNIVEQLQVDAADVLLLDRATNLLYHAADLGFTNPIIRVVSFGMGEGLAGKVAQTRRAIRLDGFDVNEHNTGHLNHLSGEGFKYYYGIPLIATDKIMGVLELYHRDQPALTQDWENLLESLSSMAAIAIDNSTLFEDLQRSNTELTLAYDATIQGWANALELRDGETEGHSRRVVKLVVDLAHEMGFSEEELVHIRRGALLHDIGKMGIPDSILMKNGPLTPEEWQVMRRHPEYAYQMLKSIDFLQPALVIPRNHHEKWDGSGYPRALQNKQIPLEARIFAVVDVWDALTSPRPYRPAWDALKAREYIRSQSGIHFDPAVVTIFWKVLDRAEA